MSKSTDNTIWILLAALLILVILLISTISSTTISTQAVEPQKNTTELQDTGYWEIFSPNPDQPIFNIDDNSQEEFVRDYNMKIDCEMDIISQFIKKSNSRVPQIVADRIAYMIVKTCEEHDVPNELIIGIIEVESFYDPYAVGIPVGKRKRRARGLGQVLDSKCGKEHINEHELHNIDYNILYTVKIIKNKLVTTDGDLEKSLYYYVGKDETYAAKVFKTMGEFIYFRSQKV